MESSRSQTSSSSQLSEAELEDAFEKFKHGLYVPKTEEEVFDVAAYTEWINTPEMVEKAAAFEQAESSLAQLGGESQAALAELRRGTEEIGRKQGSLLGGLDRVLSLQACPRTAT